jgi:hypothetical protein
MTKKTETTPPPATAVRTGPMEPPYLPLDLEDVDVASPSYGYTRLPDPTVFRTADRRFVELVETWFYQGVKGLNEKILPKEGIDATKAIRHLKSVMGTWDTKHEDKMRGVAFLMQTWFEWKEKVDG